MDPSPESEQTAWHELRILVLHNKDFDATAADRDPDVVSRADVANAARDVARALVARGHFVEVQGIDSSDVGDLLDRLRADRPDLVFNLCESLSTDARHEIVVPSLLDLMQIPYTGSGPATLCLCLRKYQTKLLLRAAGIPTPPAALLPAAPQRRAVDLAAVSGIGYPLFVKLEREDGSLGISHSSVVRTDEQLLTQVNQLRERYAQPVLVEKFIHGRELNVPMLGNAPRSILPLQEIDFSLMPTDLPRIVSYEGKWNPQSVSYKGSMSMRAQAMPSAVQARVEQVAQQCFEVLEVSDYGRCDMRLDEDGTPYVIEMNPNCDLSETAGYSKAGHHANLSYDQLIEKIAIAALERNAHVIANRSEQPRFYDSPQSNGRSDGSHAAGRESGRLHEGGAELRLRAHRQRPL